MNYRRLGKTNLKVSEIGFGAWAIGGEGYGPVSEKDSLKALETAFALGINFFDTADIYGAGESEKRVASFLKGKDRTRIILATKAGHDFYQPGGVRKNFDSAYLRKACDESLKRLQTDYLDIYQLHNPSEEILSRGEAVETILQLKNEGKIRFTGVSVFSEKEALAVLKDDRVDVIQLVLNLMDQTMLHRALPMAEEKETGIIIREALARGWLSGNYGPEHEFAKTDHRRGWSREQKEEDAKKLAVLKDFFKDEKVSLARIAFEFALSASPSAVVLAGIKNARQAEENVLASSRPQVPPEKLREVRALYLDHPVFKGK